MHPPPISSGRKACLRHNVRGFTAIELMVTVGIAAILAALAAPSFTWLMERWRVRQAMEGLHSTLLYARSEAIKRNGNVMIRKLPNNTNGCTTASGNNNWDCGWQVLACDSINASGTCAGPVTLQRFDAPAKLVISRTSGGNRIILNRWGLVDGPFVGFSFIPQGKGIGDPLAHGLCMSSGGRVRVIPDPPCTSG
ncbi:MAG: GspH/FimT family pseudopilin [Burkholderiaceae bacterium]